MHWWDAVEPPEERRITDGYVDSPKGDGYEDDCYERYQDALMEEELEEDE